MGILIEQNRVKFVLTLAEIYFIIGHLQIYQKSAFKKTRKWSKILDHPHRNVLYIHSQRKPCAHLIWKNPILIEYN